MDLERWRTRKRLRRIARRLNRLSLQRMDDLEIHEDDLFGPSQRFLGYYTEEGIVEALEAYGLLDALRADGFDPVVATEVIDLYRYELQVRDGDDVLLELVCRKARLSRDDQVFSLLCVEWLLMQHPRASFPPGRLPFPGQDHPGLGHGREVFALLEISAERLGLDGVLCFPEHYHNGVLYGIEDGSPGYHFFSPERQGELLALERDLASLDLAAASWAVDQELVLDASGHPYAWRGEEMVLPVGSGPLADLVHGAAYRQVVTETAAACKFTWDEARLKALLTALELGKIRG